MVDFYEVHGKAVEAAAGQIRAGEIWNVALREPLPRPALGAPPELWSKVVRFLALPDGQLKPATEQDRQEIREWNARHRETPRETFWLPPLWRS